jgi:RNA polymerase subunit RPABC4/transcription elongation factor Spt4
MIDTPSGDEAQRVRACLACGELVTYEERSCPHCGHHEPLLPSPPAVRLEPCSECTQEIAAGLIFCPRCGADRGPEPEQVYADATLPSQASTAAVDRAALLLMLLGPALMAVAVLLTLKTD